jgi:competence protein ComEC
VAALPGAALAVPRPPLAALLATVLGGLWLCLWRTSWRRLGLIGLVLGLLLTVLQQRPDLLIDDRGQIVAVRLDDGRLALSPWKRDRWITDSWLQDAGQDQGATWPESGEAAAGPLRCYALGCVLERDDQVVALAREPEALEEDCARAAVVISYPRIERCPNGRPLIGPQALKRSGGLALWLDSAGIEMLTVREVRGERPWSRQRTPADGYKRLPP